MLAEQDENRFRKPKTHLTEMIEQLGEKVADPFCYYPFRVLLFGRLVTVHAPIHPHIVVWYAYNDAGFFLDN